MTFGNGWRGRDATAGGQVALPDAPGLGIEVKAKLYEVMKTVAD